MFGDHPGEPLAGKFDDGSTDFNRIQNVFQISAGSAQAAIDRSGVS